MDNTNGIHEILEAVKLAERICAVRDYAKEECDKTWASMTDYGNNMSDSNRRQCCKNYAKKELLCSLLDDICSACSGIYEGKTGDLYDSLLRKLPS